jgi:hypothetical protein
VTVTPRNPFVGLRPFEAEDSILFFGRQQQAAELIERLHQSRFVAVVGSSGCGKSSLVRAGLIPKLQAGFLVEDRDVWHVDAMKPGDAPMVNLAAALLDPSAHARAEASSFAHDIQEGGVPAVLDRIGPLFTDRDSNLLLLVDQFEEIFRFDVYGRDSQDGEGSSDFVAIMLDLAAQREVPVYVIMTMRSDFLGDCDRFAGLPESMNRSQYLVPRLTRQQRREVIEGPIRLYGKEIAQRLTDRLLNESIDTRDDLPVLQHALMRTWDNWEHNTAGPLDIPNYDAIGTMHAALSKDAASALKGMSDRQMVLTRRLFQSLTTTDSAGRRIRQRARLADVAARSRAEPVEVWAIVQRFRAEERSFIVASSENFFDNPLVDISHESLIRQWETLTKWVDEERESIRTYDRLAETALLYEQKKAGLYRDPDLQVALDWRAAEAPNETWAKPHHANFDGAMRFLDASKAVRDAERWRAELERRWRMPRAAIGAVVLGLFFASIQLSPLKDIWGNTVAAALYKVAWQIPDFSDTTLSGQSAEEQEKHREQHERDRTRLGEALTEVFRVGFHLLLFLGLNNLGRRIYGKYALRAVPDPEVLRMKEQLRIGKLRRVGRVVEEVAKWSSLLLGFGIIGACGFVGGASGSAMFVVPMALIVGLALVGWVFATARLNADVHQLRKEVEGRGQLDAPPVKIESGVKAE